MKLQDVILKAMAKKISWLDAAEIIGVSDRTMRRMRESYQQFGYTGLMDRRKGKQSSQRVPMETAEEVLRFYREVYFDVNIRHFHEKLRQEHQIELSYTWVQLALQGAGLVARRRKRGPHRRRRPRRPLPGMLLHIDGSKHRWLNDDRWHDLIVILDDATSEIYYAQLVEEESTRSVMAGLREVIENTIETRSIISLDSLASKSKASRARSLCAISGSENLIRAFTTEAIRASEVRRNRRCAAT